MQQQNTVKKAIQSLQNFYGQHRSLSGRDYRKSNCTPTYSEIIILFGSWDNALAASGITSIERPVNVNTPTQAMSKDEAAKIIKNHLCEDYKVVLLSEYIASGRSPTASALTYPFGTWRKVLQFIGIDVDRPGLKGRSLDKMQVAKEIVEEAKAKW